MSTLWSSLGGDCRKGRVTRIRWSLDEWAALDDDFGPPFVDASGNGDGIVCGLALPDDDRFGRLITALGIELHADVIVSLHQQPQSGVPVGPSESTKQPSTE